MISELTGPSAVFSGPMGADSDFTKGLITAIEIIQAATFTTLVFQFPAVATGQTATTGPTYPPLMVLRHVKTFRLLTGAIRVFYRATS